MRVPKTHLDGVLDLHVVLSVPDQVQAEVPRAAEQLDLQRHRGGGGVLVRLLAALAAHGVPAPHHLGGEEGLCMGNEG